MRGVVFPIFNTVYFASALRLAKLVSSIDNYQTCFFFSLPIFKPTDEQLKLLHSHGISVETQGTIQNGIHWRILSMISSRLLLVDVFLNLVRTYRLRRQILKLIRSKKVALFMLPADNRYSYPQITALAKSARVKVAIFPSWFANETELTKVFSESADHTKGLDQGMFKQLWKAHVRYFDDSNKNPKPMIPFPKSEILSRKIFHAEVPNPWILHSTNADKIFVENATALAYATKLGFTEDQLVLTGSVFLDEMHSVSYERDLGEIKHRKLITSALPPDMFSYPVAINCEFKRYSDLVDAWCSGLKSISRADASIVIALHPTSSSEIIQRVTSHGIDVSREDTHLLIARSDFYIASISATIQWAISAGVPTLNYDVYNFDYPDYEGEPLVTRVNSHNEFIRFLSAGERTLYRTSERQTDPLDRQYPNTLDGQSGARLLAQIQELVGNAEIA